MVFCLKCGKEIDSNAKFCPHCGAVTSAGAAPGGPSGYVPPESPVYTAPKLSSAAPWGDMDQGGGKRRGTPLVIGAVAAAVLVVVLIVAAIGGLFSSPKGQVKKALAKTAAAYAGAGDKLGMPELDELIQGRSCSQRMSYALNSMSPELTGGYSVYAFKGLGLRISTDYDHKGRKMDAELAAFLDGEDLAAIQLLVDGGKVMMASPEFTKGQAYGLNTETLGKNLVRLGAWSKEVDIEKIGFNLFDLMDKALPDEAKTKEVKAAMAEACKQLFEAIEAEKAGRQKVDVNGKSTDADLYHVVVPKDAMKDFIDAWEDAMKLTDPQAAAREVLLAMGFDKSTVSEMLAGMDTADLYGEMADTLKQAVKTLGDLELDVYVSGGYVCAVEYSERINSSKVELGLYLGGGENYVDDLSLEISVDGQKFTVESSGDHGAKKGVFTDETVIKGGNERITSELRWEPKADKNNFDWEVKVDSSASISMEGRLTTAKNSIDLKLDDLSVKAMGAKLLSLEASYYLGPCKGMTVSLSNPKLLSDMDKDDLEDLIADLADNAQDWSYDMMDKLPADLLNGLGLGYMRPSASGSNDSAGGWAQPAAQAPGY